MILYKTNQNWFSDVSHLARSWTMVRITRSVFAIGVSVATGIASVFTGYTGGLRTH